MLPNNQEITEEIKEEIKKYLGTNDNEYTITQSPWDAAKTFLSRKFIAIPEKETRKIANKQLTLNLKQLEKEGPKKKKNPKLAEGKKS